MAQSSLWCGALQKEISASKSVSSVDSSSKLRSPLPIPSCCFIVQALVQLTAFAIPLQDCELRDVLSLFEALGPERS
ncbi:hypothetical protein TNCV_2816021 [Trichonephila clavipes]|nr:hypothetical protein TNCV_2816021 [Trichonephila clavipes]